MSHPCGSYNSDTLEILKNLGIELGFKQIMNVEKNKGMRKINNSHLEIARENHSQIFKEIYSWKSLCLLVIKADIITLLTYYQSSANNYM